MNETKRLVDDLREDAEWAHANEWESPITLGDHLDTAADMIEELSTKVEEYESQIAGLEIMLTAAHSAAETWQRRAKAAERDIIDMMKNSADGCPYCKNRPGCKCSWDDCKPEWRGPCEENRDVDNET